MTWFARAACVGADPEAWFPGADEPARPALDVCEVCTVQTACLDYALTHHITEGIWGGCTASERRRLARHDARWHPCPMCGRAFPTSVGLESHERAHERQGAVA